MEFWLILSDTSKVDDWCQQHVLLSPPQPPCFKCQRLPAVASYGGRTAGHSSELSPAVRRRLSALFVGQDFDP
jgi:hypothetical protein